MGPLSSVGALSGRSRRPLRLNGRGSVVERWVILVVLTANESVEVLEARTGGPMVIGTNWRCLEHWNFVAFSELRCRVAVELQGFS